LASRPRNRFLASLSAETYGRLAPALRTLPIVSEARLPHCGETRVYFPETGACSIVSTVIDGRSIEVASVGYEGAVGLPQLALGRDVRISCRHIGDGVIRYASVSLIRELSADPEFDAQCHEYQERFTRQVMQLVACNQLHPLRARCARWILLAHDRLHRARFELTQGFLAQAMGVDVRTLAPVIEGLDHDHIIKHDAATITVHDPIGLRHVSCSCYAVLQPAEAAPSGDTSSVDQEETPLRRDNVIPIRPAAACALCGLGRDLPHGTHHECLRAIDAELLGAIRQVRTLTVMRKQLLTEVLLKYQRLLSRGAVAR